MSEYYTIFWKIQLIIFIQFIQQQNYDTKVNIAILLLYMPIFFCKFIS
jgi:hypothetical protein